jgi:predicted O-methyltransferase YrrM
MRIGKSRGSYLPVLATLVSMTQGPILELGVGFCSTPYLHWACYPTKRRLVSYENNPEYYDFAESWKDDFHEIHCIKDWAAIDISEPWSIAFVDHSPGPRRPEEMKRLTHADYVIAHDTENSNNHRYHFSTIFHLFKYRWKYNGAYPYTSIFSNRFDVRDFKI